ncbi:phosphoglycolate phosphatase [Citrobacter sp. JGM124]|uniref:phosphoglycolate phosphatase n=1 Tax=Citrobacter sp. JGM124 TaxID=2799789 RepID=UPI001BAB26F7|nr:phosphoglycolate phosphatase [Citrobacter sp. JGM124]MBS0848278.1 phosphoglycolate phosphatase [Citrobacter sp. JGM124]
MDKFTSVRGIAFDLDGTLIDSSLGLSQAVDMTLYAMELPGAGEERVITWIGNGADILIQRALEWGLKEKNLPQNSEQLGVARKLFDRFYAETVTEGSFLFPEVLTTLEILKEKGFSLGIVTNKPTPFVMPLLESFGIAQYFQVIIGGDDVKQKKPHPEALFNSMKAMQLSASEMMFVGDSRNDIQAAQAAGCPSVGLTYGYNYGEAITLSNPDVVCERFSDLLPLLGLTHQANQESEHE